MRYPIRKKTHGISTNQVLIGFPASSPAWLSLLVFPALGTGCVFLLLVLVIAQIDFVSLFLLLSPCV